MGGRVQGGVSQSARHVAWCLKDTWHSSPFASCKCNLQLNTDALSRLQLRCYSVVDDTHQSPTISNMFIEKPQPDLTQRVFRTAQPLAVKDCGASKVQIQGKNYVPHTPDAYSEDASETITSAHNFPGSCLGWKKLKTPLLRLLLLLRLLQIHSYYCLCESWVRFPRQPGQISCKVNLLAVSPRQRTRLSPRECSIAFESNLRHGRCNKLTTSRFGKYSAVPECTPMYTWTYSNLCACCIELVCGRPYIVYAS